MTPLSRTLHLIALSASSESEEARTAAFQACRLIRENGFEVVEKRGDREDFFEQAARAAQHAKPWGEPFAGVNRQGGATWADVNTPRWRARHEQQAREAQAAAEEFFREYEFRQRKESVVKPRWPGMVTRLRFSHRCEVCGEQTEEQAFLAAHGAIAHPECIDRSGNDP